MEKLTYLEKMYYDLSEEMQDIPELDIVIRAIEEISELVGINIFTPIEEKIMDCYSACEKQGFIYGFKYGLGIRQECEKREA